MNDTLHKYLYSEMAIETLLAIIYNMPVSRTGKYRTEILIGSDDHSGSENTVLQTVQL